MTDCLFCKIIKKEIPANIVFENDNTIAFRDINPVSPTHILVIPKNHISGLIEINNKNSEIISQLTETANIVCEQEGIFNDGFRFVINSGENGGQTVFHLHLHILGGRKLEWPPG